MPLGTEIVLDLGYIVLDGDPAPAPLPTERDTAAPHISANVYCCQTVVIRFHMRIAQAKCILVTRVCVCLCVCPSPHSNATAWARMSLRGNGRGFPLVVNYWTDLQLVHGFHCYDNMVLIAKCQRVLVLALCLVNSLVKTGVLSSYSAIS